MEGHLNIHGSCRFVVVVVVVWQGRESFRSRTYARMRDKSRAAHAGARARTRDRKTPVPRVLMKPIQAAIIAETA